MHKWKNEAKCLGMDTNIFFNRYEEDSLFAASIDSLCQGCPVRRQCFAVGVSNKEWGVWGGVYLRDGIIDKEANAHKNKNDWFSIWQALTMEVQ